MSRMSDAEKRAKSVLSAFNADYGMGFTTIEEAEGWAGYDRFLAYRAGFWSGMIAQVGFLAEEFATPATNDPDQNAIINAELLPDGP